MIAFPQVNGRKETEMKLIGSRANVRQPKYVVLQCFLRG